jgi:undecaprenyl-diphosphatase
VDRDYGARFSFLLAIPAILGALVFQARELMAAGGLSGAAGISGGISAGCYILGFLAAALSGAGAVGLMLKIVRERSLWGFSLYTGLLGGAVLLAAHFNVLGF